MFANDVFFQYCKRIAESTTTNPIFDASRGQRSLFKAPITWSPMVILNLLTALARKSLMAGQKSNPVRKIRNSNGCLKATYAIFCITVSIAKYYFLSWRFSAPLVNGEMPASLDARSISRIALRSANRKDIEILDMIEHVSARRRGEAYAGVWNSRSFEQVVRTTIFLRFCEDYVVMSKWKMPAEKFSR